MKMELEILTVQVVKYYVLPSKWFLTIDKVPILLIKKGNLSTFEILHRFMKNPLLFS